MVKLLDGLLPLKAHQHQSDKEGLFLCQKERFDGKIRPLQAPVTRRKDAVLHSAACSADGEFVVWRPAESVTGGNGVVHLLHVLQRAKEGLTPLTHPSAVKSAEGFYFC